MAGERRGGARDDWSARVRQQRLAHPGASRDACHSRAVADITTDIYSIATNPGSGCPDTHSAARSTPDRSSIELAIKFPVTTVTTVSGAQSFFGRDEITLKVTAEVRLAVDLSQAQIRRDGNTLLIRLPRATVSGEPNPIEIEVIGESRRWIGSQITAAQNQALAQARADIKQRVAGDQGLISIASEVAYRRLERWLIDDLGFSRVVIEPLTP